MVDTIPLELWEKIVSFLSFDDRCALECVNRGLSEVVKSTWAQLKSLSISAPVMDSTAKLATLLRRCGSHLEDITIERDIRLDTEAQLFQLCPNLRGLSFTRGNGLLVARDSVQSTFTFYQEAAAKVHRFLEFMPRLERLQLFRSMDHLQISDLQHGRCETATLREMIPGMVNLPNLWELHLLLTEYDGHAVRHIGALQHLRVLSVMVPDQLFHCQSAPTEVVTITISSPLDAIFSLIGQLHGLEQLYVGLRSPVKEFLNATIVGQLATALPDLNSLALRFSCDPNENAPATPVGSIDAVISQFAQLRTLVIVCRNRCLEGNEDGPVPVDLNPHRHRQVPLNIFVADYNRGSFTGYSPQINVISMPNGRYGEAVDFLSTYHQNGFNFGDEQCLQMVKMSKKVGGEWDFSTLFKRH